MLTLIAAEIGSATKLVNLAGQPHGATLPCGSCACSLRCVCDSVVDERLVAAGFVPAVDTEPSPTSRQNIDYERVLGAVVELLEPVECACTCVRVCAYRLTRGLWAHAPASKQSPSPAAMHRVCTSGSTSGVKANSAAAGANKHAQTSER